MVPVPPAWPKANTATDSNTAQKTEQRMRNNLLLLRNSMALDAPGVNIGSLHRL
jgi:hypothetical protein